MPAAPHCGRPLVIHFHGGGWVHGDRRHELFGAPALARSAGAMTFLKFAGTQLFKPEMSPFTIGGIVAFLALGSLSLSSDKAAREASPFVTPKKHH